MGRAGQRKHKCRDCGAEQWVHWTSRARRTRERCINCGSTWLDPVTKEGKEDVAAEGQNLKDGLHGYTTGGGLYLGRT